MFSPKSLFITQALACNKYVKFWLLIYRSANVRGTIITGWQRYDHFATLCELLPVGIPSLAVCLSTLQHAGLPKQQLNNVNSVLGCSPHRPIQWSIDTKDKPPPMCSYPGHRILEGELQPF